MGSCSSSDLIVPSDKNILLGINDVISLRNSWRDIVHWGEEKFATDFMLRLLKKYPDMKHLWWFMQEIETEEDLIKNPNALSHGQKLFNAIDKVIYNLEDINLCCSLLINLGELHYKKGIKDEHFQPIEDILSGTLANGLGDKFDVRTENVWKKFMAFVEYQMKIGLYKNLS